MVDQPEQCKSQTCGVACWHQESVLTITHDIPTTGHVCGHDGPPTRCRFDQCLRQALPIRGQADNMASLKHICHILAPTPILDNAFFFPSTKCAFGNCGWILRIWL